jgi:hypothetical protein
MGFGRTKYNPRTAGKKKNKNKGPVNSIGPAVAAEVLDSASLLLGALCKAFDMVVLRSAIFTIEELEPGSLKARTKGTANIRGLGGRSEAVVSACAGQANSKWHAKNRIAIRRCVVEISSLSSWGIMSDGSLEG